MTIFSDNPYDRRMERLMMTVPNFAPRGVGFRFTEARLFITTTAAMYRLGICFETGNMTEKDLTKAAEWIFAAAETGYAPALEWIKDYSFDDNALIQAES